MSRYILLVTVLLSGCTESSPAVAVSTYQRVKIDTQRITVVRRADGRLCRLVSSPLDSVPVVVGDTINCDWMSASYVY